MALRLPASVTVTVNWYVPATGDGQLTSPGLGIDGPPVPLYVVLRVYVCASLSLSLTATA